MKENFDRRDFLKQTTLMAAGTIAAGAMPALSNAATNNRVRVGIIGCNARGMRHIAGYLEAPNVEIAYICDVDKNVMDKGIAAVVKKQKQAPKGVQDLRMVLDDKTVDAVSIATPDHWHTPATIMACKAGKHVYVEKPGSHNLNESEMIVAAARKYKRLVQMGNQRRSWPWLAEAVKALRDGELGKVFLARGWYTNRRESIGHGKVVPVPETLDYALWQGPAVEQPYRDNLIHYNWHWFWNYGTGETGNNGVHALDVARWGLGVEFPKRVTCGGGRYFLKDDQETPDTITATFDFGGSEIVWEGHSCAPRGFEDSQFGVNFYGENGCMVATNTSAKIYDAKDKFVREISSGQKTLFQYDADHFRNFIGAIREGKELRSEIAEGQKSTTLCHLANIAWRTGETVDYDPVARKIIGDGKAARMAGRQYRPEWEPSV